MPQVKVYYRESPRAKKLWRDTYTPITFGEYYANLPADVPRDWIAVDYSADRNADGKVQVLVTEFDCCGQEDGAGPHEPRRFVVAETVAKTYDTEHAVEFETDL